jgi:hypothetical protein
MVGQGAVEYIDVDRKEDLPAAPEGRRYLDFLGGTRQLRCYLVPADMPRIRFMRSFGEFDECLTPLFHHAGVVVQQDASYALPGFFVVSFDQHHRALDSVDEVGCVLSAVVIREARIGMRVELGISNIHLYYEEKIDKSCHVHYWMVPVPGHMGDQSTTITRLDLRSYLTQFRFQEQRDTILRYNERMREYFKAAETAKRMDRIRAALSSHSNA